MDTKKSVGRKKKDITGQRFGYLIVINNVDGGGKEKHIYWKCKCDCGNFIKANGSKLRNGEIKSCGCYHKKRKTKHGYTKRNTTINLHNLWRKMLDRCYNPNNHAYKYYGGRNIKVYRKWWKFENFYKDMGDRPKNMTLERINNNDDYKPSNCKWATMQEQMQNTRTKIGKGYSWSEKAQKWIAHIRINYKKIHLGCFDTPEKARKAYLEAKEKYHKKFL